MNYSGLSITPRVMIRFADRFFMFFFSNLRPLSSFCYFFLNLVENLLLYFTLNGKEIMSASTLKVFRSKRIISFSVETAFKLTQRLLYELLYSIKLELINRDSDGYWRFLIWTRRRRKFVYECTIYRHFTVFVNRSSFFSDCRREPFVLMLAFIAKQINKSVT